MNTRDSLHNPGFVLKNRGGPPTVNTEHFGKFLNRIAFFMVQRAHYAHIFFREFRLTVSLTCVRFSKMFDGMMLILKRRDPLKILGTIIRPITIEMVATATSRRACESRTNQSMDVEGLAMIVLPQTDSHVTTLVESGFEIPNWSALIWSYASHLSKIADLINSFVVQNVFPFFHYIPHYSHYTTYGCQSQMRVALSNKRIE